MFRSIFGISERNQSLDTVGMWDGQVTNPYGGCARQKRVLQVWRAARFTGWMEVYISSQQIFKHFWVSSLDFIAPGW